MRQKCWKKHNVNWSFFSVCMYILHMYLCMFLPSFLKKLPWIDSTLSLVCNYRVIHKFSYTWNELFVVNWFISKIFWGNTKWKNVSCPHYLKILMKLSKHGISYSLRPDPRSISKITFYANLIVNPIDIKHWFLQRTAISSQN